MDPIPFPTPEPSKRERVRQIIKEKSYSRRKVTLASGRESEFYLDMKPAMMDPEGSSILAELVFERLRGVR
jgi:orotate phosphoribosyltransferase